ENGGKENAFTGRDFTAYYQQLEKSRLEVSFRLEADRMRGLLLPGDEVIKEREVVVEERRLRTDDNPGALTGEQFMATAFQVSPYHNPIIGWGDDIAQLSVEDLKQWYHLWYSPNNAILVVAGDVEPEAVIALATRYFGPIPPSTLKPAKRRNEPEQRGERRVVVRAEEAKLPSVRIGFKVPVLRTASERWRAYALEVAAHLLDGGDSARMSRELVRGAEIAASAGAGYDLTARLDSLFILSGTPVQGVAVEQLEKALLQQVERLQQEPIAVAELEKVKAQVMAGKVYELDSVFSQALQIGLLETVGLEWEEKDRYVAEIAAVTAEQVQQVAREYLTRKRMTVATLIPETTTAAEEGE
ncbi:MAG: insulinase family protein, partial [Gammaproteobacteria bacterium]|nr:insulinase family protein [Gammaproteobacteria bacterium]